jgi:hypothetical protein
VTQGNGEGSLNARRYAGEETTVSKLAKGRRTPPAKVFLLVDFGGSNEIDALARSLPQALIGLAHCEVLVAAVASEPGWSVGRDNPPVQLLIRAASLPARRRRAIGLDLSSSP